jgi:hypothetical protein
MSDKRPFYLLVKVVKESLINIALTTSSRTHNNSTDADMENTTDYNGIQSLLHLCLYYIALEKFVYNYK